MLVNRIEVRPLYDVRRQRLVRRTNFRSLRGTLLRRTISSLLLFPTSFLLPPIHIPTLVVVQPGTNLPPILVLTKRQVCPSGICYFAVSTTAINSIHPVA